MAGTSFAAPQVSGLAALMLSINPNLYNDDIENIIKITAEDKGAPGRDVYYGYGRINAGDALELLNSHQLFYYTTSSYTSSSTTDMYMDIYEPTAGLNGEYLVSRRRLTKTVTFPYVDDPHVWGRGIGTTGWAFTYPLEANHGYMNSHAYNVTNTSATIQTCVYYVSTTGGSPIGWYPCEPGDVVMAYTVMGILPPPAAPTNFALGYCPTGYNPNFS
jgi:hypothetical protein